ncbi:hypothetical protein POM88_001160 [Heracleum sosnowskyi]|uniref:Uncharacterized protein n=1 Tax=Heracleum sosnowskyi TaxID=360622 RepID=A0AAD8JBK8_9APIA|nr:hypothetical protein POM88_001160 [Heracleum sosnowskyi]
MVQRPKRTRVKVLLTSVRHVPSCVNAGDNILNARTEPVGRRFANIVVLLNVFRMAFCAGVFSGFSRVVAALPWCDIGSWRLHATAEIFASLKANLDKPDEAKALRVGVLSENGIIEDDVSCAEGLMNQHGPPST